MIKVERKEIYNGLIISFEFDENDGEIVNLSIDNMYDEPLDDSEEEAQMAAEQHVLEYFEAERTKNHRKLGFA